MPPIVNQIAEELLPLIFRRNRLSPRQPIGNDLPEQGGYSGQMPRPNVISGMGGQGVPLANVLSPQEPAPPVMVPSGMKPSQVAMPDETRPRLATPNITAPASPAVTPPLAPDPVVSRSGQVMDEYSTRPSRRVETDTRGRPTRNITLEGDDQTLDYAGRVAKYEPQEGGGGWWPKIRAALMGFAAGGPVGAGAAFGTRMLREKFEPKLADEEWKRRQMGEVAPAVESIRQSRKDTLQEDSTRANIDLAKARTSALGREKKSNVRIIERSDGVYAIDPETRKAEKIADIPPEAGRPGATRYISRADGVYGINAEHPQGFKVSGIPGNAGKDEEDVSFGNAQLQRVITEAQAEQAKIDAALPGIPMTIEATDILTGTKKMAPNPEYTYNMTRRRQLDDQIRRWRTQLKAPKKRAASTSTVDDPLGILEDEEP